MPIKEVLLINFILWIILENWFNSFYFLARMIDASFIGINLVLILCR